jgi:hypothetical protein
VDRRRGRGSPLRRHGCRDGADADAGGLFVLLSFPGIIHVLRFLSAVRFRSNTRFPGIIVARGFLCFIRYTGIIHAAPRIIHRPATERRFCLGAGPCCEPKFLLCIRRFRRIPPAVACRFSQGLPRSGARRSRRVGPARCVGDGGGSAAVQCRGPARSHRAGPCRRASHLPDPIPSVSSPKAPRAVIFAHTWARSRRQAFRFSRRRSLQEPKLIVRCAASKAIRRCFQPARGSPTHSRSCRHCHQNRSPHIRWRSGSRRRPGEHSRS